MTDSATNETCRGCSHPQSGHYTGPDPEYPNLESVYCGAQGCLCWVRFAIWRRQELQHLTIDRKPPPPPGP